MIKKVDHIGVAVENFDETVKFYSEIMGLKAGGFEVIVEQKVKVLFFQIGDTEIDLLEYTDITDPIAYIQKRKFGIQHIAFQVDNIEETLNEMRKKGIGLIDEIPRYGAGSAKVAFLHPKSTNGILIELSERK